MRRPAARACSVGGCLDATVERRSDGTVVLRSTDALETYPERITDALEYWAELVPERTLVARRNKGGDWIKISYAQMLERARRVATALRGRELDIQHPVAILSENSLEHLTLALGAMYAGIPHTPVSPAYALLSRDYTKLRFILDTLTPGLVYVSGPEIGPAIEATVAADTELVMGEGELSSRHSTPFGALLEAAPISLNQAHRQIGADSVAKILFTSGSTKVPKGVINTHRMLCANQQMIRQSLCFLAEEPPVLIDWLPWNHTFGGNHNVGIALYNGGTLYIDDGKPTPQGIGETLRNLREIAPTVYFNVPKGFEEIAAAMERDHMLRERLFSRVRAFFFAGAGMAQPIWDQLDRLGERTLGERIPVYTGLGMTETSPSSMFAVGPDVDSGHIGLPVPGIEAKLVPVDGKLEVRFRGPNVMPGYWRSPENTDEAFDEEGYYRTGDAACFIDPDDVRKGLRFDGRIAEDFKLSSGTFVNVGMLRARILEAGAPCVQDAVITAPDRDNVGVLLFPRLEACRRLAGLPRDASLAQTLSHAAVRGFFQDLVDDLWREGTGSANRVAHALILHEPPSIGRGEITDKGSINQRAVLKHRSALIDAMYEGSSAGQTVLLPNRAPEPDEREKQ